MWTGNSNLLAFTHIRLTEKLACITLYQYIDFFVSSREKFPLWTRTFQVFRCCVIILKHSNNIQKREIGYGSHAYYCATISVWIIWNPMNCYYLSFHKLNKLSTWPFSSSQIDNHAPLLDAWNFKNYYY